MEPDVKDVVSSGESAKLPKSGVNAPGGKHGVIRKGKARPFAAGEVRSAVSGTTRKVHIIRFGELYRVDPSVRINMIKKGVRADVFARIARSMDRSKEQLSKTLGLSVTTIDRKAKVGGKLSPEQGERVVGMAKLIGQVQTMVEESGDPTGFDAAQWLASWLDEPLPALGGQRPAEYMDTAEGRDLVSNLLAMAQSGAYA